MKNKNIGNNKTHINKYNHNRNNNNNNKIK